MPPAVRPPAKSITPPTHLDEIQPYLAQTAAGARRPQLIVCKHICMKPDEKAAALFPSRVFFFFFIYIFFYAGPRAHEKTAYLHLRDAIVPGFSASRRRIICWVIIRPRPRLSNSWSGTSPSITGPLRRQQGGKNAREISKRRAPQTLFPLFCPHIISIPLHKPKMSFRYKARAEGA